MKEFITKFNREKGYSYTIDREGNVYKEDYNWFKDPYTLVAIAIVFLSLLYFFQLNQMMTIEKNFETTCLTFVELRNQWMQDNPGKIPTMEEVFSMKKEGTIPSLNG